jgi:ABC-type multidrug transport system fused ATPase/permease subunit
MAKPIPQNTPVPSTISAVRKLRALLTRAEKLKWVGIMVFALCTSSLEILTASVIVLFAQVLNQPDIGQKYLSMIGFDAGLSSGHIIFYIAIIVGAVYFIKNIIAAIEVFYQNFSIQKMNYQFKNKLLYRYANVDYGFHMTQNSSLGASVVGSDAEMIFSSGMISIANILSEGIVFLCLIMMVVFMKPSLALTIFAVGMVLGIAVSKGLFPMFYRWGQKLQESALYSNQNLLQFFYAFKEIILFGKRDTFINAYQLHSRKKSHIQAIQAATNALPRMIIEVLFVGLFVTTISFLCLEQESAAQMTGILGGYLYVGFRLMPGLNRIINQLNLFKAVIPSIERVYNEYTSVAAKQNYVDVPEFVFEKSLKLDRVSFSYPNTNTEALKNITLEIRKGEYLGIIGETGSGKSTLVDIILGLLQPCKGSVRIDANYLANAYQWHKKIGYVPQSIYLADDTVEANIAFGEQSIDKIKLNHAINVAQLRQFINQLPKGSRTIVGERGIRLSGGERQRIAIARALYNNPEVIIFDEATSALDNETEARLIETIHHVSQGRTVIMIAHRLTTLKACHRIVTIEKGSIKQIRESVQNPLFRALQYGNLS